jgi:hypothetical protein
MSFNNRLPFSDVVSKGKVITSAAVTTLITRVPWQPGAQKTYHLRKVSITSTSGVSATSLGNIVTFWDQDLSSATPAVRGNASNLALLTINSVNTNASGGSATVTLGLNELPRQRFEAGICCQATNINTAVILELEMY